MNARLLIDSPGAGSWNMAVDEALMISAGKLGTPALRFYAWKDPTLSLGYFQAHADRHAHEASRSCALVRRATGGGAILHHFELTYSFVAPISDRLSADVESLYYAFHETLIDVLLPYGVEARLCTDPVSFPRGGEPFWCFERRARGDVLLGDAKIAGSAQRRHYGAVLQHGSILLLRSPHTPHLPGIGELSGRVLSTPELIMAWTPALARRLNVALEPSERSQAEEDTARCLEAAKFGHPEWTERR